MCFHDSFLQVYAEWCAHSKNFMPSYEKLARAVKFVSTVQIAKIDMAANDIVADGWIVEGYPAMLLVQARTNRVVKYNGERDFGLLLQWLQVGLPTVCICLWNSKTVLVMSSETKSNSGTDTLHRLICLHCTIFSLPLLLHLSTSACSLSSTDLLWLQENAAIPFDYNPLEVNFMGHVEGVTNLGDSVRKILQTNRELEREVQQLRAQIAALPKVAPNCTQETSHGTANRHEEL